MDEGFRIRDDLRFELPAKVVNPATQTLLRDSNGDYAKRDAEERLSWFATLVPDNPLSGSTGVYLLSVAVVAERNAFTLDQEIEVAGLPLVTTITPVTDIQLASLPLGLKSGHWIMLVSEGPGALGVAQYNWYRVISVDNNWVTINGPDWDMGTGRPPPRVAIIVPKVVAVYTKTIRLETSAEL